MSLPHSRSSPPSGGVGYQNENDINLKIPYVFGSSRPRDLSYLDFLPAKLRVYNTRLRSSMRSSKDEPTLSDYLRQLRSALLQAATSDQRHRDRSVDSASRYYVFGSSTPRDLSYLERIPWDLRIYDVKLSSRSSKKGEKRSKTTSFSSSGSGGRHSHRRTSSLNLLESPSPNSAGKLEQHDNRGRLVRSAHENIPTTPTPTSNKVNVANRSKSSRPPSNASQGSSQKVAIPKKKEKIVSPTEPIEVQCPNHTPTSSALPSHELTTFEASSPTSDEFFMVPNIGLKSETNVGLSEEESQKKSNSIDSPKSMIPAEAIATNQISDEQIDNHLDIDEKEKILHQAKVDHHPNFDDLNKKAHEKIISIKDDRENSHRIDTDRRAYDDHHPDLSTPPPTIVVHESQQIDHHGDHLHDRIDDPIHPQIGHDELGNDHHHEDTTDIDHYDLHRNTQIINQEKKIHDQSDFDSPPNRSSSVESQ